MNKNGSLPWKVQPLLLKRKVLDHGQSQHENHLHSKTHLHDYHDSAASANVENLAFYSKTCHRQQTYSHIQTKTPCHFATQFIKMTSHFVHFQSEKKKHSVHFAARGIALLWSFFHLNCSVSGFVHLWHWFRGTSIGYNEPGQVEIPAVRVFVVWALNVVSARLIETTLFMGKLLM